MVNEGRKKMKIKFLYDFLSEAGGIERVMLSEAEALRDYNLEFNFSYVDKKFAKNSGFNKFKIKEISKFPIRNESLKIMWAFIFPSLKKTDLFISHSFLCSTYCYRMKKKYEIPYAVFLHHPPQFLYFKNSQERSLWANTTKRKVSALIGMIANPFLRWLDRLSVRNANLVLVNSEFTRKRVKRIYNIETKIIYPPVKKTFKKLNRNKVKYVLEKYGIKGKFVLSSGRVIPDKKFEWVIEAFSYVKQNTNLVICGQIKQGYKNKLINLFKRLNLEDKVKLLGFVPEKDLIALYNLAEAFVLTAPKEDFGLMPIEALSCGCPVIAWDDNAGPNETVKNDVNGFLVKPYNLKELAKRIDQVISNKFRSRSKNKILKIDKTFSEDYTKKLFLKEIKNLITKV